MTSELPEASMGPQLISCGTEMMRDKHGGKKTKLQWGRS